MLHKWSAWSCYRGQFNNVTEMENGHVSWSENGPGLKEGEWSCYRSGQFNGGRSMVMLQRWPVIMAGRMVMLRRMASLMERRR